MMMDTTNKLMMDVAADCWIIGTEKHPKASGLALSSVRKHYMFLDPPANFHY